MTAVIHKISVGVGGKHTLSPEESPRRSVSFGKLRVPLRRRRPIIGVPTKNPRTNKLDSSMLKSKNQVTLFVNYSYNNFYDFHSSENK